MKYGINILKKYRKENELTDIDNEKINSILNFLKNNKNKLIKNDMDISSFMEKSKNKKNFKQIEKEDPMDKR